MIAFSESCELYYCSSLISFCMSSGLGYLSKCESAIFVAFISWIISSIRSDSTRALCLVTNFTADKRTVHTNSKR